MKPLLILFGYLVGSIPSGFLIASRAKVDIRTLGSGNIGATNVRRVLGWKWGIVTFLLDFFKAALVVWLSCVVLKGGPQQALWVSFAAGAVLLGNVFPFALRFRGGKGVATTFGIFLPIVPQAVLIAILIYGAIAAVTKISAIGSVVSLCFLTIFVILSAASLSYSLLAITSFAIIAIRHRQNFRALLNLF